MKIHTALAALFIFFAAASEATAATADEGYNEVTIRHGDVPRNAPRFENYPAERYTGKNAKPVLNGDATTRMFRSRIKNWSKARPNFAGHYILATWGCGPDCIQVAIIDVITGKVTHPAGITTNVSTNVHQELLERSGRWCSGSIKFRTDSKLLVLIGMPEEDTDRRGISYYVLYGAKPSLKRFVPKAWYQGKK